MQQTFRPIGQISRINFEVLVVFSAEPSEPFFGTASPLSMISILYSMFIYKKHCFSELSQIYSKYGMCWPKRIWKLAILRPYSVVHTSTCYDQLIYLVCSRHLALLNLACLAPPNGSSIFNPNSDDFSLTSFNLLTLPK